jgi:hypothetical protein
MARLSAGSSVPDTILTQEPVANAEFTNAVGEFKGSGINNLNEEEMGTLTQEIEEKLLKKALSIKNRKAWDSEQIERRIKIKDDRAEKEKNDVPKENEGMLIPQIGLSKYDQITGLKRRRGILIIMVAKGESVDHIEAAYDAIAQLETIKANLGDRIITLSMVTKGDKAKRGMLSQGENEIQDNIKTITDNRSQIKTIGYKGTSHDTISNYERETNEFLAAQGSTGKIIGIEHHTAAIAKGDMEIFIISVSSPKDRDLILGLIAGMHIIKLTYTEAMARGPNMKFGRKGMLQVGQLTKEDARISFRTKGEASGMNDNPDYMKAWAEAANEMKKQLARFIPKSVAYIGRWALFTGGLWPPKQGRGPVAIKTRHARRIRGKKVL